MSNMKLHNASYCQDRTVIGIADLDTGTLCAGMHDQPAANIHSHMTVITDQISRLCTAIIHTGTAASLLIGSTGNTVTEVTVYPEGKSGTIRTIRQAGTARHINGSTSRMLEMPVRYMTQRSKPRPKPAWRVEPYLRRSR